MESQIYPLTFRPVFKEVVWGGRKLETVLDKRLPSEVPIGESWEVSSNPAGISVIDQGPLEGMALPEVVSTLKEDLVGTAVFDNHGDIFPLLVKFIDAKKVLSVQVHPDAAYAAVHDAEPKTEAWCILDAEPGATLIRGVKPGTTREEFARRLEAGELENCLNRFEVHAGDVIFIPAGMIHAIGAGILLAEIQQSSDTTYRVFDWNRMGLDGQPRQLHVQDAMNVADFSDPGPNTASPTATMDASGRRTLVECDAFAIQSWDITERAQATVSPERFELLLIVAGSGTLQSTGGSVALTRGTTVLLPAALGEYSIQADTPLKMIGSCPR